MAKDGGVKLKPTGKKAPESDDRLQAERFKETARQLGADETGEAFEAAFVKIVPKKPYLSKKLGAS